MRFLHDKLGSTAFKERIIWVLILFFALFFGSVVLSYYLLPEGILRAKNPLQSWQTSKNMCISTFQIFGFNLLSVLMILFASLFGRKKPCHKNYLSVGYTAFFALICLNGVTLGTWSFSVISTPVPLLGRFLRTFDLLHRAGLWEMLGQLFITCSVANIGIVLTDGKDTITKNVKDIRFLKSEKFGMAFGLVLMIIGAAVESMSIIAIG